MTTPTGRLVILGLGLLLAVPAAAQDGKRSLHWAELQVQARLDDAGRLHVRERHGMVFRGDWNGGERELEPRLGQTVRVDGVYRVVPGAGELLPLSEDDDLEEVDQYEEDDGRVRWRSRLPGDPPFDGDRIDYVIDYVLSNAVLPHEGDFLLDHDFVLLDRAGTVERFSLSLTLDEAWSTEPGFTGRWEAVDIPPGNGFAVRLPLEFHGTGSPGSVLQPPATTLRWLLALSLIAASVILLLAFYRRERAAGRYAPLPRVVDQVWIEEHVLSLPPEVVGAAWDRHTGAAEVAGLLARLVQEGRLASHVEDGDSGSDDPVLHLELRAPRDEFVDHERELIDALFFDGRQKTDTETVKEHYKATGFDPASKLSPVLGDRVDALAGGGKAARSWGAVWSGFAAGTLLLIAAVVVRPTDALPAVLAFIFIAALGTLAMAVASVYAQRVTGLRGLLVGSALLSMVMVGGIAAFVVGLLETSTPAGDSGLSPYYHPGSLVLVALVVLAVTMVWTIVNVARSTDTPQRLALRRKLAAAEAHFRAELERPEPALRDEWFPYLLAFGLGRHIDRWFSAYGADPASTGATSALLASTASSSAISSSGSTVSSGTGWTGGGAAFGGGGGFSGGGVGGSWGAAAGTIATGVSSPSSGGSAGGVASSGGGGGGGW